MQKKNISGNEVSYAFKQIFEERIPKILHTDKCIEFIIKSTKDMFKKNEINWFTTENETLAQIVEKYSRTLKN